MRFIIHMFLLAAAACAAAGTAPQGNTQGPAANRIDLDTALPASHMSVGVFYYPEQWPQQQWSRDLGNIAKLGFEFTHFGEFAWTYFEPEEGRFDFAWLDKAIDLAHRAGLKVILCTPSAAVPAWMGERYPEVYRVDERGQRHEHGIRADLSLANPRYRDFVNRMVKALGERYGHDKRVWGWQLDNEPGSFADYSPSAQQAFRRWLRQRYASIDALNEAWAGSFWSTRYAHFDQVRLPNPTLAAEDKLSPHALLDLARFQADTTAQFLDGQAALLRERSRDQWITTNYTNVTTGTDPRRAKELDFSTFTLYPVAGANILGGDSYKIGNPTRLMEAIGYYGSLGRRFGLMELQPGQVNWSEITPQPARGAIRMWMWHAYAGGVSLLGTYRYRHPLRGSEMYHEGIVGTDGVTLSRSGKEFTDALREVGKLTTKAAPRPLPARLAARKTGLLWSHDVYWDLEIQRQTTKWQTWAHRNLYSQAIKSTGAPLQFVSETDRFADYPFLVAPAYQMVSTELVQKWRSYVEGGGHLILTPRSGHKDAKGHFPEAPLGSLVAGLVGADIEGFDVLPDGVAATVTMGGRSHTWQRWADLLAPRQGSEVLARYAGGDHAGKAAAVTRRLGRGSVTYIGVWTDDGVLERTLLREVYRRAGVAIEDLPPGTYLEWRDGLYIAVNYNPAPSRLTLPQNAKILLGSNPLAPAQVLVWEEATP
ncbi:beta-galactosidase [Tahibacter aquaticus]|uniref:beta-galactosidase n=1 Tax=Tahibacter aquaticus TaxID=520092 RepID=UPI001FB79F33|nr:beta-galactosidase [Tahibacter aquaticus]